MDEGFRQSVSNRNTTVDPDEEPLRDELLSVEGLEQYAALLAAEHKDARRERGRSLQPRLEDNEHVLIAAYKEISDAVRRDRALTPAAEWLIDNFHIVDEQLREIREDLPAGYYRELPKLRRGELHGYPRIYALALALVSHTDSRLDANNLKRFIRSYQQVTPLTIGEVWAIAITLRIVLVENLRRIAARIVIARRHRDEADMLADKALSRRGTVRLVDLVEKQTNEIPDPAFVVRLTQRLRDQDPQFTTLLEWLDRRVERMGMSAEEIVQREHHRQAAAQVTVANIITSMRLLSTLDWKEFFESVSLIDPLLGKDPAGAYAQMDFATRDRYRHEIERLSKNTDLSELVIGQRVLDLAHQRQQQQTATAEAHVGYYLIDAGRREFERAIGYRATVGERTRRLLLNHPNITYLGTLVLIIAAILAALEFYAGRTGAGYLTSIIIAALFLVPASELGTRFVNWATTLVVRPHPLPKMDVTSVTSEAASTFVVIPTILSDADELEGLLERLEIHFLANQTEHLYFGLLFDFADAPQEAMPADDTLIRSAQRGIDQLNAHYPDESGTKRFHLFQRRRKWNESEGKWIGWERKRGKLREFNRLLRGASDTSFVLVTADKDLLAQIRYVITLDGDTQLPRNSAARLIGTALHPLNHPQFDKNVGRVVRGYGILQPRISIALESASLSRFARIFSGNTGIDPYTTAVSDVYQDLFGEGIYTGKGLYEVDAFEAALADRVPENTLLSHDLFEGLFARAALVTDIELIDDYPTAYHVHAHRQHRWTRGDWQVSPWLFSRPVTRGQVRVKERLPIISRWKIADNLRRSLVAPTLVLSLITGWTILPGSALFWTAFSLLSFVVPLAVQVAALPFHRPPGVRLKDHLRSAGGDVAISAAQVGLNLAFLAHQAYLMIDAVVRTTYRMIISHRHLLEWVTAARVERVSGTTKSEYLRFMWMAPLLALGSGALILKLKPEAIPFAAPLLLLWLSSPWIAQWTSRIILVEVEVLTARQKRDLRRIARCTWRYFEALVGEADHWLPPDNYQEDPQPVVAHRTSPTNVGLFLLSTIAAHDFGYVATLELIERLELTFTTLERLPRFRGHFFNWYDTHTLEPLTPQYVSTVDSGNLAGHLLVVKRFCHEVGDYSVLNPTTRDGLADTVEQMTIEVNKLGSLKQRTDVVPLKLLKEQVGACEEIVAERPATVTEWSSFTDRLGQSVNKIQDTTTALAQEHGAADFAELRFWISSLQHQLKDFRRDLETLLPWSFPLVNSVLLSNLPKPLATEWQKISACLESVPALCEITEVCDDLLVRLAAFRPRLDESLTTEPSRAEVLRQFDKLVKSLENASGAQNSMLDRTRSLARLCDRFLQEMDFHFLFDDKLKVLTVGYNVSERHRDNSFYDLLASEARLASFAAISTGDIPEEHWFRLGRQLTSVNGKRALISWSGTMFEYLMPLLVMANYKGTLMDETYEAVVAAQIAYGRRHNIPWGISESAYNARDLHLTYQYGPFGIPGLGLKRGLGENLVVAPYATMLAAMVRPRAAVDNLAYLEREGARAHFGFYESIDYTPGRMPRNHRHVVIRAFMTHHQGMILVSLDNVLHERIMQRRFHAEPMVQADELLLQERIPRAVPTMRPRATRIARRRIEDELALPSARHFGTADLPWPATQLLSNGAYNVMITTAGGGYSSCRDIGVTRWREDGTRDNWGTLIYLRDVRSNAIWSAGYQPTTRIPQSYEVTFAEDKADVRRTDVGIATHTEVIVSAEDNAEMRRVSIANLSSRVREIELTSYAEITLVPPDIDASHPAFSNLFIETEFVPEESSIFARRRPRSENEQPIWAIHTIVSEGKTIGAVQYETDRNRFLGRGRNPAEPVAVVEDRPLSNTVGPVLDPIFSLRRRVLIGPGETARVCFSTAVAASREEAMRLADKYHDINAFERQTRLVWTKAQVEMRHLDMDAEDAHLFQELGSRVLFSNPTLRPRPHVLDLNSQTQTALWKYGISGDLPIVVVRISDARDLRTVRQLLRGHEYLRLKGLAIDLVILNDHPSSYLQELHDELEALSRKSGSQHLLNKPGGIFLRRADIMSDAEKILLHAVARVVIVTERGSLEEQLLRPAPADKLPPPLIPRWPAEFAPEQPPPLPELRFFNGIGGFSEDGREYVIRLGEGQWTPAPWSNVISNSKGFGFLVTETGSSFTWSLNSRDNRLTPWSNDAVCDPPGEVLYLRDEDTGTIWTPTPLPIREAAPYTIRHGQGYTIFEHTSNGISQELLVYVAPEAPVKIMRLRLRNLSGRKRRLSLTTYHELVLGNQRSSSAPFVISEVDPATGAIFARNPYNNDYSNRVAFVNMSEQKRTFTCDRKEFLGRNGSLAQPAALRRTALSGRAGAGLDPCAAIQADFDLAIGEEREVIVLFGQGEDREEARQLVSTYVQPEAATDAFNGSVSYWQESLGAVEISTPDPAMDLMVNRWLLYQTHSCRLWARSALYQSSGAYGFRDQLQDVMALSYSKPDLARAHILLAASRQFEEGDVQHWWHPNGRGLRTRFSDDLLWLPFATAFYVNLTGDVKILDEQVPFIVSDVLREDELESYSDPKISSTTKNIFEHCSMTIDRSMAVGVHGLPLMGSGDWNDGMNRVGFRGKGESVWLGWFLYKTLDDFSVLCDMRGETGRAIRYRQHMQALQKSLEAEAWDGDWYRRAFFDDGTPLGSARNDECRIDSIAQSWAVISNAANPERRRHAMAAVDQHLVHRDEGLVCLLTPPFDKSALEPGYIKGYVPGVRENGGQYTHAALWTLSAFALLGDGDRAGELFALLNPVSHATTRAGMHKYKVEPYVVAADVYAVPPHGGRGGWTWYTGAAGWMYRVALESILGISVRANNLTIQPCIPRAWPCYQISYRRGTTVYEIEVDNPLGVSTGVISIEFDGQQLEMNKMPLTDDGKTHSVKVTLGHGPLLQPSDTAAQVTQPQAAP